jgi:UDP-glucose 4-epimerase
MKALVTGGTGLVGRYIVETLLAAGHDVTVAGRTPPPMACSPGPSPSAPQRSIRKASAKTCLPGSMPSFMPPSITCPDATAAAKAMIRSASADSISMAASSGFKAAKRAGVGRAVFLSSRAVYDGVTRHTADRRPALQPASLYGEIKLLGEQALAALNAAWLCTSSLRLTGVYGDLRPNKWDSLFADYLAGPCLFRSAPERKCMAAMPAGRAADAGNGCGQGRGQSFNVSDLVADTRDILASLKAARSALPALPSAADKTDVAEMDTAKIRSLGWRPGGMPLFEKTLGLLSAKT